MFPPPYKALPNEISFKYKGDSTFYLMFVSKLITRCGVLVTVKSMIAVEKIEK